MVNRVYISIIFIFLISCTQIGKQEIKQLNAQQILDSSFAIKPEIIDYKSGAYNISLGGNYKSDSIIDWRWASENDDDGKIDSIGKDAFYFTEEPIIKYNNSNWLPSLHIKTDKNIITSFTCSVLFELTETKKGAIQFLKIMSKDIQQLKQKTIIDSLLQKGFYKKETNKSVEVFKLTKKKKDDYYDTFEYSIKLK